MPDQTRYVAITREGEKVSQTFVVDGKISLDELFKMVNDRPNTFAQMAGKSIRTISIHLDESLEPTFSEKLEAPLFK
ncbi:MAG TPA: hypothetical protein VMU78_05540 [Methylocella sp.]|nr:hypothetical protein [Methylocella sp.]